MGRARTQLRRRTRAGRPDAPIPGIARRGDTRCNNRDREPGADSDGTDLLYGRRDTPAGMNTVRMRIALLAAALMALVVGAGVASAAPGLKTIRYHGYRVAIPAAWPVIDLAAHPTACVRFDRHALYLGTPGTREVCPGAAIGHTEALLIEPAPRGPAATRRAHALAPASGTAFAVPSVGVIVVATWSAHESVIVRALGRHVTATASVPAPSAALITGALRAAPRNTTLAPSTTLGFDTCTAPSLAAMAAWTASPYRTIGVYLGGANSACAQPNLTPGWVQAVTGAGWRMIPTYVGLQGPGSCGGGCATISASQAKAQGTAAANDAASKALALGIPPGNPIYDDMEQYNRGGAGTAAVMAYLSGWTSQLHADGYTSGVYSSASSGITDLVNAVGTSTVGPDEIWIGDWNGLQSTTDPYVPASDWSNHQRVHQYQGGHTERYGGTTLDIDSDFVDGATAGTAGFPPPDGSFVSYQGKAYRMAGGAPLYVSSWAAVGEAQPSLTLTTLQWHALRSVPSNGTLIQSLSTGKVYEIAGGAPLYVSNVGALGSARTVVGVDQWDLANLTNTAAHLRPYPADGTFVTVAQTARAYRIVGDAPFPISSWTVFGGLQPSVTIDSWDVLHPANPASRLRARPVNGTRVKAIASGIYWRFASGYRSRIPAAARVVPVDDAGLALFPVTPPCTVPKFTHLTIVQARAAVAHAFCALGTVHRPRVVARGHVLHVTRQSAKPGIRHITGYRIGLTLS